MGKASAGPDARGQLSSCVAPGPLTWKFRLMTSEARNRMPKMPAVYADIKICTRNDTHNDSAHPQNTPNTDFLQSIRSRKIRNDKIVRYVLYFSAHRKNC